MAEYEKKVRIVMKKHGCFVIRQGKGDHEIWHSIINGKNIAVDSKIKSRHSANAIMKECGIDYKF